MGLGMSAATVVFIAVAWTVSLVFSYCFGHYCGRRRYRSIFFHNHRQKYIIKRMFAMPDYGKEYEGYFVSKYVYTSDPELAKHLSAHAARMTVKRICHYKPMDHGASVAEAIEVIPVFEDMKRGGVTP